MAAAYVGSAGGAIGGTFSDSLTFTTTRTINAGERVVAVSVIFGANITSLTVGALSLSSTVSISSDNLLYWSAPAVAQITSGATVTVQLDTEVSGANKRTLVDVISGTSSVRTTADNTGFGTAVTTGTTNSSPQAGDLSLAVAISLGGTTVSAAGGGLTLGNSAIIDFRSGYEALTGGADSGTFTLSTNDDWWSGIVVWAATPATGAQVPMIHHPVYSGAVG